MSSATYFDPLTLSPSKGERNLAGYRARAAVALPSLPG